MNTRHYVRTVLVALCKGIFLTRCKRYDIGLNNSNGVEGEKEHAGS